MRYWFSNYIFPSSFPHFSLVRYQIGFHKLLSVNHMASNHAFLNSASIQRDACFAKPSHSSAKRKQSDKEINGYEIPHSFFEIIYFSSSLTVNYLFDRNYDPVTKGPKLGFEASLNENHATQIYQTEQEENEKRPVDMFKLQSKKQN